MDAPAAGGRGQPLRIGVVGAPVTRPLDFVDAFLAGEIDPFRSESVEHGAWRLFVVEAAFEGRAVLLQVAIPPRHGLTREAFSSVLATSDVAVLLVGARGRAEQAPTLDAFAAALAAQAREVPVIRVLNEHAPPRLESAPIDADVPCDFRGRICWWRHEKSGTSTARSAILHALHLLPPDLAPTR